MSARKISNPLHPTLIPSYQQMIEKSFDGVWAMDTDFNVTFVNERLCEMLGFPEKEILGKPAFNFMFAEDAADHESRLENRRALKSEQYERRLKTKKNDEIWVLITANPVLDDKGNFAGSFSYLTDITLQKRFDRSLLILSETQSKLTELEDIDQVYNLIGQKIHELVGSGIVGTTSVDENADRITINRLYGVGKIYNDLVDRFKLDPLKISFQLSKAPPYGLEIFRSGKLLRHEKSLYDLLMRKVPKAMCELAEKQLPLKYIMMMGLVSEGRHFGGVAIFNDYDVSEYTSVIETMVNQASQVIKRLKAEKTRRVSEAKLTQTLEAINEGYWDWNVQTGEVLVSSKWFTMLDYEPGEFKPTIEIFTNLIHPEDRWILNEALQKAMTIPDFEYHVECRVKSKKGVYRYILTRGRVITRNEKGEPTEMVGTHTDISRRKNLEAIREIFYETQRKILQSRNLDELFASAGNGLHQIIGNGFLVVSRAEPDGQTMRLIGFYGLDKRVDDLTKQLHFSLPNNQIPIKDIDAEDLAVWRSNKLSRYEKGLHEVLTRKIPKAICRGVEKALNIREIYIMGCGWHGQDFGGFTFLCQSELGDSGELVESLVNETSIAMQRILTDEASHVAQERFQRIFEKSPVGIVTAGADNKFLTANQTFCELVGYTEAELRKMSFLDITHPDYVARDSDQVGKLVAGDIRLYKEVKRYIRKDGSEIWAKLLVNKVTDAQGKFLYNLGMVTDISKEITAEHEMAENRQFLELVLDTIPNYVFVRDEDGRYRLANQAFAEAMGTTKKEIIGKTDLELGDTPELAELVNHQDQQVILSQKEWVEPEIEVEFSTNRRAFVQFVKRPLPNLVSKKPAVLAVLTDVSERRKNEQIIRKSEEKYRLLTENMKDIIWTLDVNTGEITYISPSVQALMGYSAEELLAAPTNLRSVKGNISDFFRKVEERVAGYSKGSIGENEFFTDELEFQRKDGTDVWVEVVTSINQKPDSGNLELKGVARDITERKRAEFERQVLYEIMRGLGDSKDLQEFLTITHASIAKVIDAKNISVVFYNRETGLFEEIYTVDEFDPPLEPSKLENSLTEYVFKSGISMILRDEEFKNRIRQVDFKLIGKESASWMGAPLKHGDQTIGVIFVQNYQDENCYTEKDREFLTTVASQVALAIDRKHAEDILHESEERYRTLVENAPIGIMLVQQGKFLYANNAGLKLFGAQSLDDFVGVNVLSVIHPDSQKKLLSRIFDIDQGKSNPLMEIKIIKKNGETRETESTSTQIKLNGETVSIVFGQDISKRKRNELEVQRKSDDLLLLKALNDSVNRGDSLKESLMALNREAKRLFSSYGATVYLLSADKQTLEMQSLQLESSLIKWIEERIGFKIPSIKIKLRPQSIYRQILDHKKFQMIDDPKEIMRLIEEFTDNRQLKKLIPTIARKLDIHSVICIPLISNDESVGLLELSSNEAFVPDDLKRLELISSELGSIIRRKQAEEALKDNEEKFRQIVERANDIFIRQDFATLDFLYVSPVVTTILGYQPEEILSLKAAELNRFIHPDDHALFNDFRNSLLEVYRSGSNNFIREFRFKDKQGLYYWFLGNYSLLLDEKGQPLHIICTLSNITGRKHNENILNFRVKLMQQAPDLSLNELLVSTVDEVERLTDSQIGFLHFIDPDQEQVNLQAWSSNTTQRMCTTTKDLSHYPVSKAGVWAECIPTQKPVIHNRYDSLPTRKELPEGHARIVRELVVPICREGKVVAILGVGNKETNYTDADQSLVSTLSDMAWDIIENKINEEALKESQTIFKAFMENSPIYVFFKDKEIRSKQLSRNFEKMLGKPLDELLDKNMYDLFPSELAASMVKDDQRILFEGKTIEVEEELNGRYYTTIKFPIYKDGVPDSLAGFTLDITDRVISERKLAESEELYRLISSVVSDYLFSSYIDENNTLKLRWVAGAFEKITGYSMADYTVAGGWRAHVFPEDYALDDQDLEILRQNKKVITEIRTIKKDGSVLWVQVYSQPIWDEEKGKLVGINGAVQDISARKRAEEEIKKSALEFEALYETAKDFSVNRDPDLILSKITDRACSMFGVSNAFVYLYDPDSKMLEMKFSNAQSDQTGYKVKLGEGLSGKVAELQQAITLKDYSTWSGRLPQLEGNSIAAVLCVPMMFGGELIGVLGVQEYHPSKHTFSDSDAHFLSLFASQAAGALYSADLFDKLRRNAEELEKRVDERTKELQLKNKELETFTYTVSHDLKAPLRGISGYSTLLMEDHEEQLDEEGKRYLGNLVKSTERMNLLIEDLLAYSRAERQEIKRTDIPLEELVDKLLVEHHAEIEKHNIIISKDLGCPILYSDREALTQALRNLIDNAIKFTFDRPEPKIIIRSKTVEDRCLISVEDNGVGFDMQYHDKIFEIFQRLHLSEDYPGTGVGLALVRKAVDRLGGKVWAESEPGVGSTFYMDLPL